MKKVSQKAVNFYSQEEKHRYQRRFFRKKEFGKSVNLHKIFQLKKILVFGAGKSATVLISYLINEAEENNWHVVIADTNKELALSKINNSPFAEATQLDIHDAVKRAALISDCEIVISMMPPDLHFLVAKDCVDHGKHLLTASYLDDNMKTLSAAIENKKLLFLCEMGLDPGIDHMSAMKIINGIKSKGGTITSFKSHCGGLVAPESDDNPWHYKISWNPRNIIMAGKAGAVYKLHGHDVKENYGELFEVERGVQVGSDIGFLSYYPNRDSMPYIDVYGLHEAETFMRTTLRYPDFMYGWNNVIELKLTDETPAYDTDGLTLAAFFKQHFDKINFGQWLNGKLEARLAFVKELSDKITKLMEAEKELQEAKAEDPSLEVVKDFSVVDEEGNLQQIDIEQMKDRAAYAIAHKMHEANQTLKQLFFLGMDDQDTMINKGYCSAADVLQFSLEKKLALSPTDKDMIVMLHEFEYILNGKTSTINSSLVVKGEDGIHTAMAKTVGLPLGIAAKLILNGTIRLTGLHIPTNKEIYEPVLEELEKEGIRFEEIC